MVRGAATSVLAATAIALPALGLETGQWTVVSNLEEVALASAPAAGCGADAEFKFGAYKGTVPGKLIIEFEGGGLCFNKESCLDKIGLACTKNKLPEDWSPENPLSSRNHDADEHPLKEWSHLYIPYCTCDFYWGNRDVDFSVPGPLFGNFSEVPEGETGAPGSTFQFRGYKNFQFVMEWIDANSVELGAEEQYTDLLVTGCSAGAFGSSVLQHKVIEAYPEAKVAGLMDSAFGSLDYLPLDLFTNLEKADIPFTSLVSDAFQIEVTSSFLPTRTMSRVQQAVADAYPQFEFAVFANLDDPIINSRPFLVDFIESNDANKRCNLRAWVPDAESHCFLPNFFFVQELPDGSKAKDQIPALFDADVCTGNELPVIPEAEEAGSFKICSAENSCFEGAEVEDEEDEPLTKPEQSLRIIIGSSAAIVALSVTFLVVYKCSADKEKSAALRSSSL